MKYQAVVTFPTERALRNYVRDAQSKCISPDEFEQWLANHTDKLYVQDIEEPYSASELAELV